MFSNSKDLTKNVFLNSCRWRRYWETGSRWTKSWCPSGSSLCSGSSSKALQNRKWGNSISNGSLKNHYISMLTSHLDEYYKNFFHYLDIRNHRHCPKNCRKLRVQANRRNVISPIGAKYYWRRKNHYSGNLQDLIIRIFMRWINNLSTNIMK